MNQQTPPPGGPTDLPPPGTRATGTPHTGGPPRAVSGAALGDQWMTVCHRLRREIGDDAFASWIQPLSLSSVEETRPVLVFPNQFMLDWVASRHGDRLLTLWQDVNPGVTALGWTVGPCAGTHAPAGQPALANGVPGSHAPARPSQAGAASRPEAARPDTLRGEVPRIEVGTTGEEFGPGTPLDPSCRFDNFVTGKSNEFAYAAARRVADSPAVSNNPLFLHGGVGLGKTHLMHAIAWQAQMRDPSCRVVFLTAERFMQLLVRAIRFRDQMAFKDQFRSVDMLLVDDVQFLARKDTTQDEFFHTFNALIDSKRQIVISADRSPSDLEGVEERIRSRLGWGLVADIHQTDYELRLGILQVKLAERSSVAIPDAVLEFMAHRIVSNVRELEGALNRLIAHADLVGRPVTLDTAQDVLRDLLRANERRVTIEDIQQKAADYFGIRKNDLLSPRRAVSVARPRQVAMYLSKQLTNRSLPEIGRRFGNRDHTTVMHAVRRIESLMAEDPTLAEDVETLRRILEG